jgi:hypothetical protein
MKKRNHNDSIIITIIPHLLSLYFTYNDIMYTSVILLCTLSSYMWHLNYERQSIYMYIDYLFAGILSTYEIVQVYKYNNLWFEYCILLNCSVLIVNKSVYILSKYKYIKYNFFHSMFHLYSAFKTCFIAYISNG